MVLGEPDIEVKKQKGRKLTVGIKVINHYWDEVLKVYSV